MGDNLELFDDSHADLGRTLDRIDDAVLSELKSRWPQLLADLIDLVAAELARQGVGNSAVTSSKLVYALAHYFGGRAVYLPNGDHVKAALREYEIFNDWSVLKGDIYALMDKYRLTQSHIYDILRRQMALHRKRYQPDMFGGEV